MQFTQENLDFRIKQELVRILYSHRLTIFAGSFMVVLVTTLALWPVSNKIQLSIWAGILILLLLVRLTSSQKYVSLTLEEQNIHYKKWANQFVIGSLVNGVIWGSSILFFFTEETLQFVLIICIHAGYISASSSITSIYLPAYLVFVIPSTALFVLGIAINGGVAYWPFLLLTAVFGIATIATAKRNYHSVSEQISLRLQNTELMKDLTLERDNAKQAMLAKNHFLAAASHDLRQPVHALGLFVDSLPHFVDQPDALKIVNKIRQSTTALGGLFHGLLDISKLDANVVENKPHNFLLDELLIRLSIEYSEAAEQKNLTLNIPTSTGYVLYSDLSLLERIIRNIMSNAIKYTSHGAVTLECQQESAEKIEITVTDTGKGIPESEHENIFSEYHQLENPERDREKGLGLGLAIVWRLCQLMEIPVRVKSSVGKGSTFSIVVPEGDSNKAIPIKKVGSHANLKDLKIVIIDDEIDILDGMRVLLTKWGCTTHTATSTAEALAILQGHEKPDLIIADFRLRDGESGLDSIQLVRDEFNDHIPAVLITGDTSPDRLQQAALEDAKLLHKPVEPEILKEFLADLVGGYDEL